MADDVRARLLAAGSALAERTEPATYSVAAVCSQAGVDALAFTQTFGSERQFLLDLHAQFLKSLLERVIGAFGGKAPGEERLRHGTVAFLDACLERKGLRGLLLRHEVDSGLLQAGAGRRQGFMQLLKLEFEAMGWLHAGQAARLYRPMIEEASAAELEAGRALPEMRQTLFYFIRE